MPRPKFVIQPVQATQQVSAVDRELLAKTVDDGVYPLAMAKEIRLDRIKPDPNQPRRTFDGERLEELAASIRQQGILQPIVVEYIDDGDYFRIVHGERRFRAAQIAGLLAIPAIIHKVDDENRLARQLIENIQREDLNDVDRGHALKQLKVNLGSPSWEVVADKVGISKRRILQLIDTTKLPEEIQNAIRTGELTEKHGRALKKIGPQRQPELVATIREQSLSGDETLAVARLATENPQKGMGQIVIESRTREPLPHATPTTAAPQPVGPPPAKGKDHRPSWLIILRTVPAMVSAIRPEVAAQYDLRPLLLDISVATQRLLDALPSQPPQESTDSEP